MSSKGPFLHGVAQERVLVDYQVGSSLLRETTAQPSGRAAPKHDSNQFVRVVG